MASAGLFPRGSGAPAAAAQPGKEHKGNRGLKRPAPSQDTDFLFGNRDAEAGNKRKSDPGAKAQSSRGSKSAVAEISGGLVLQQKGKANRLELVSFKKVVKGTLILGVVSRVSTDEIAVSLPSSLTGVVRRAEISDQYYSLSQSKQKHSSSASSSSSAQQSLSDCISVGQVVRCCVQSIGDSGAAGGRKIELSLRASVINKGLTLDQLREGAPVWGSVSSVEDHGYVIGLGLDGISAFLHKNDVHPADAALHVGQPVDCAVKACKAAARAVFLTMDPALVRTAAAGGSSKRSASSAASALNLRGLKPGMLIEGTVDSQLQNGVLVSFLEYFSAGLDYNHMPQLVASGSQGWRSVLAVGSRVKARILMIDYASKAIRLTQRPHLMELRAPDDLPPLGETLTAARVVRTDPAIGLLLDLSTASTADAAIDTDTDTVAAAHISSSNKPRKPVGGYVHISRISDSRSEHIERHFKPDQEVACRVVGHNLLEGWAVLSLKASALAAAVLNYSDVQPGQVIEGEVASIETYGLLVKVGEGVRALCPNMHLTDVSVKTPKHRHKVGAKVQCKVLQADPKARKITVTMKKSLLKDKQPPITEYAQAEKGTAATGFVTRVTAAGVAVTFYNNVHGFIPAKVLNKQGVDNVTEAYSMGQVLNVVVLSSTPDATPPSLYLTLNVGGKLSTDAAATDADVPKVSVGQLVSGTVLKLVSTDEGSELSIKLHDGLGTARLPACHLCDHAVFGAALARGYEPGTELTGLLVVQVSHSGVPLVTCKPLLLAAAAHGTAGSAAADMVTAPITSEAPLPGQTCAGWVGQIQDFGVFVRFQGGLSALCPRSMVADRFTKDCRSAVTVGDSVRCTLQKIEPETNKMSASLKRTVVPVCPSALFLQTLLAEGVAAATAAAKLDSVDQKDGSNSEQAVAAAGRPLPDLTTFPVGCTRDAAVVKVGDYGVLLHGDSDSAAMLCPQQPDQDPIAVSIGDRVKVRVLSFDPSERLLEVSLDPEVVKGGRTKARKAAAKAPRKPGQTVTATVLSADPDALYAVALLEETGELAAIAIADYHCPTRSIADAAASGTSLQVGEAVTAVVCSTLQPGSAHAGVVLLRLPKDGPNGPSSMTSASAAEAKVTGKRKKEQEAKPHKEHAPVYKLSDLVPGTVIKAKVIDVSAERVTVKISCEGCTHHRRRQPKQQQHATIAGDHSSSDTQTDTDSRTAKRRKRAESSESHDSDANTTADDPSSKSEKTLLHSTLHVTDCGNTVLLSAGTAAAAQAIAEHAATSAAAKKSARKRGLPAWHPLAKYSKGQEVELLVAETSPQESGHAGPVTHVRLAETDGDLTKLPKLSWEHTPPKLRTVYTGVITACVTENGPLHSGLWVHISPWVRGFVPLHEISEDADVLQDIRCRFGVGMRVKCSVLTVNAERRSLGLSMLKEPGSGHSEAAADDLAKALQRASNIQVGQVLTGKITTRKAPFGPPAAMVKLSAHKGITGRVCVTEVCDPEHWTDDTATGLKHGTTVQCIVLAVDGHRIDLSLRQSRLTAAAVDASTHSDTDAHADSTTDSTVQAALAPDSVPDIDTVVRGFVCGVSKAGCFVRLSRTCTARVLLKDLADRFIADPAASFPIGKLVAGRVLKQGSEPGQVSMTLRPSAVIADGSFLSYSTLRPGQIVKGTVKAVSTYGVFVQIDRSDVRGMCHKSEAADAQIESLEATYSEGDYVKAIVLKVDADRRRVSLGLKPSYFKDLPPSSDEGSDSSDNNESDADSDTDSEAMSEDVGATNHANDHEQDALVADVNGSAQDMDVEADDASDEDGQVEQQLDDHDSASDDGNDQSEQAGEHAHTNGHNISNSSSGSDDDSDDEHAESSDVLSSKSKANNSSSSSTNNPLAFNFDGFNVAAAHSGSENDSDSDDGTATTAGSSKSKAHSSRKRAAEKRKQEEDLRAQELALLDENATPETVQDFEKMLVASPNSSYVWLKYMAFQLSLANIDAARAVAERALKRIQFRQEEDRLNIWVGLMNLELKYGSRDELAQVVERACSAAHPKRIHLRLAEAHERAGELPEAEQVLSRAAARFKTSKKVWMAYHRMRLVRGDDAGARELLKRSLQSLSRHKHIPVTAKFAQEEFLLGSRDRGRAIFEGLLASYPKRLDLWNVFIDQEVKAGEISAARSLYERLATLSLSPKRMKSVFKRFLTFEAQHGDARRAEAVKQKARDYVQSLS